MSDLPDALENRSALQSLFSPKSVAVIGATDREGNRGPHGAGKFELRPIPWNDLCGQPQPDRSARPSFLRKDRRCPRKSGPRRGGHSRADRTGCYRRVCGRRRPRSDRDFGGLQGARRGRRGARTPDSGTASPRHDAFDRPELPGRDELRIWA